MTTSTETVKKNLLGKIMKQNFCRLLTIFMIYSFSFSTYAEINCSSPKDEAEKNYCLTKDRNIERKGSTFEELGEGSIEVLTMAISAIATIGVKKTNKFTPYQNSCDNPIGDADAPFRNFAPRKITPWMLRLGGLAMITQEIYGLFGIKKNCEKYLNMGVSQLKDELKDAPMAQNFCIQENLDKIKDESEKGNFLSYCRAEACVSHQLKSAKTKKMIQGVANGVFLGAAAYETAYALILAIYGLAMTSIKSASCNMGYAACWSNYFNNTYCNYVLHYIHTQDVENVNFLVDNRTINQKIKYIVERKRNFNFRDIAPQINNSTNDLDASILLSEYLEASKGAIQSINIHQYKELKKKHKTFQGMKEILYEAVATVSNFLIEESIASYDVKNFANNMGLLGGISLPLYKKTEKPVKKAVEYGYKRPLARIVYTGGLGLLGKVVENHFDKVVVKELEGRIASFDEKLMAFLPELPPIPTVTIPPMPSITPPTIPTPPKVGTKFDKLCMGNQGDMDEKCKCLKDSSCLNVDDLPQIETKEIGKLDPAGLSAVQNAMRTGQSVVNDLASGNHEKAYATAGTAGANNVALAAFNDRLRKKFNEVMEKNKQPKIDFEKLEKKQLQDLLNEVKTAASGPMPSSGANSSSGVAGNSNSQAGSKEKPTDVISSLSSPVGSNLNAGKGTEEKKDELGLELGLDTPEDLAVDGEKVASLDEYNIQEADIDKKSEGNIFQNISSRYLKTAFPILLKEEKTEENINKQ